MPDIRHRVGISAPLTDTHAAVATRDGLTSWWTRDVDGTSEPGEKLAFSFGGPDVAAVMEVTELTPTTVAWRCAEGPVEWVDTTITFDLQHEGDETVVLFTHGGWREPVPFMAHCSTKWAEFLLGLKSGLEGGASIAWPNDPPISNWG